MRKGCKQTVCRSGRHVMFEDNVWVRPCDGRRYCRPCMRETRSKYYGTLDYITRKPTEYTPKRRDTQNYLYGENGKRLLWSDLFPPVFIDQCEIDEAF